MSYKIEIEADEGEVICGLIVAGQFVDVKELQEQVERLSDEISEFEKQRKKR